MFLEPFIAFILIRYMRKLLQTFSPMAEWNKILTILLFAIPIVYTIQQVLHLGFVIDWIWHLLILAIVGAIFKLPEFTNVRPFTLAFLPLIGLSIISEVIKAIDQNLYQKIHSYFEIAYAVALTWMVAMLIRSRKQQKALQKEREKTLEQEAQNKFMVAQKDQLELLVAQRTAELTSQKNELQHALTDLKSTQAQLIHSEKMASLGELTAGIAHEIQNPLNFVNNFSEVNAELIDEMKNELEAGNNKEAASIADYIKDNQQKITHHGRRADAIVKGMLQHSRKSTGQKEPTDINALADEYLRLSYHGLRAKDKTFNATMKTHFDESTGKINVIPQDIGRALLNLFTNAFYSVDEKKQQQPTGFDPIVSVSTKRVGNTVEISVRDNGVGIPQKVLDKIYQPFFSTKPTGQGTGLGLSLSYDIIKAHGGDIKVDTQEGEFAEFTIVLPEN